MSAMPLPLMEHPDEVCVVRLPSDEEPAFDWRTGPLASLTRTADETSVLGAQDVAAVGVVVEVLRPLAAPWRRAGRVLTPSTFGGSR